MRSARLRKGFGLAALLALASAPALGAPAPLAVTAGTLTAEPATLIALGFEWAVKGDANANATVAVAYRKKGAVAWTDGPAMLRIAEDEQVKRWGPVRFKAANMFAGSVFDLDPATPYEVRFTLSDPDGVRGQARRTLIARTRAEPMPAKGGRTFHVYPDDWKGAFIQPAFFGLLAAYFDDGDAGIGADHYNAFPARVAPGDTILVHAGLYKDSRYAYGLTRSRSAPAPPGPPRTCCGTTFSGTYYLTAGGTADKPIVIKGAGDGEAIFDGDGAQTLFNVMGADYAYFEGLTFRNTEVAIEAGQKGIAGSVGLVVKASKFLQVGQGVHSDWGGSRDFYITDNTFIGKQRPDILIPFTLGTKFATDPDDVVAGRFLKDPRVKLEDAAAITQSAVKFYGSGNVVAFNRVRNFHDGITHATYGLPDGYPNMVRGRLPVSNDIYNNDISNIHDDCVEIDGELYNIRVLRNRCVNIAHSGFSLQPLFAGPAYIIGNILYHVPGFFGALKFDGGSGALVYNNTFLTTVKPGVTATANIHFRNNLFLAEYPNEAVFDMASYSARATSDYNGFMGGGPPGRTFSIALPPRGTMLSYDPKQLTVFAASNLADFTAATGRERHSRMVDYGVFARLRPADPEAASTLYDPDQLDFSLRPGGAAIDAGAVIPGVTAKFAGAAPDLGALELGAPPPHYGPRASSPQ